MTSKTRQRSLVPFGLTDAIQLEAECLGDRDIDIIVISICAIHDPTRFECAATAARHHDRRVVPIMVFFGKAVWVLVECDGKSRVDVAIVERRESQDLAGSRAGGAATGF